MGRETEIEAVSSRTRGLFRSKLGVTEAAPPEDVKKVFDRYAQGETEMSVEQLRRFLVEFLEEGGTTLAEAKKIVEAVLLRGQRLIPNFARKTQTNTFTLDDFHHYLSSADLNPPIGDQVHHDMTAPLSHYFIYTGYNSYLTGNLLSGECSDIPIINALKRGVRVVELDLWPDSTKNDVIVFHGRWFSKVSTSTTQLSLIKCLKSIKEHAFSASPYPVIIILEDHLAKNLQDKVCQAFRGIFGDMLFSGKNLQEFPSPEDLKHRIIILTKPSTEYLEEANINYQKDNSQTEKASDHDVQRKKPEARADQEDNEQDGSIMDLINHNNENIEGNDPESDSVAASAYKSLIVVNAGKPKGALEEALKVEPNKVRCLSLAEQALEKAVSSHGAHIVRGNSEERSMLGTKLAHIKNSWGDGNCGGDFNMVLKCSERSSGYISPKDIAEFSSLLDSLDLYDLPLLGEKWTWSNLREHSSSSRIDRWDSMGPISFRTDNKWLVLDSFRKLVADTWCKSIIKGTISYRIATKLKLLKSRNQKLG